MQKLFQKKKTSEHIIIPTHIGIIMDGNGRWAKKRNLPRSVGHSAGAKAFTEISKYCNKIGVKYLTVYAFSTENWKRPKDEVDAIMNLLRDYLNDISRYEKENIVTRFIGDISVLDEDIVKKIKEIEGSSSKSTGMVLNIAVNYGGRDEIINAVKILSKQVKEGSLDPTDIDENLFKENLYTAGQPDADLIIRPSGECRLSNFLMWQSAYSEFIFMDVLWPDFKPHHIDHAIHEFNSRNRRFGGV